MGPCVIVSGDDIATNARYLAQSTCDAAMPHEAPFAQSAGKPVTIASNGHCESVVMVYRLCWSQVVVTGVPVCEIRQLRHSQDWG